MSSQPSETRPERWPLGRYALYAIAMLGAAVATFGPAGVLPGILIPLAWCYIFVSRWRPTALLNVILTFILLSCAVFLLLPAVSTAREAARLTQCRNHVKQIGLALHNYLDEYGSFPPAYTTDETGRRLHSWRVLILPFIDYAPLYKRLKLDEPWDSEHNAPLLKDVVQPYACPSVRLERVDGFPRTSYVAVTGPQTAWPDGTAVSLDDIGDGPADTVMVIEYTGDTPWAAPEDLSFEGALDRLASRNPDQMTTHRRETFFTIEYNAGHVLFADGSTMQAGSGVDRTSWSQLLAINDGGPELDWNIARPGTNSLGKVLEYRIDKCVQLAVFVLLWLFPLPWVWRNPTSGRSPPQSAPLH